jgi:hypothetical protein
VSQFLYKNVFLTDLFLGGRQAYGTLSVGVSACVCVCVFMLPTPKSLSNRLTNYNEDEVQVVWNNTPYLLANLPTFRKTSLPPSSESDLRNVGHIKSHGVTFQKK